MQMPNLDLVVVEDDHDLCELLKRVFNTLECQAVYVESAEAGWEEIQAKGTRVLLTNLELPGMQGLELLNKVRDHSPETVIFGMTDNHSVGERLEDQFDRMFYKPFIASQTAAHIHLALLNRIHAAPRR